MTNPAPETTAAAKSAANEMKADAKSAADKAGTAVEDSTITAKVKTALLADPDVKGLMIDVDTKDGVVTLKGTADKPANRDRAVAIAKDTGGVKSVEQPTGRQGLVLSLAEARPCAPEARSRRRSRRRSSAWPAFAGGFSLRPPCGRSRKLPEKRERESRGQRSHHRAHKLAENITSKVKPVHLKVPSLKFRLDVPAEKAIRKAYDEDPLLRAKLNEAAGKVYDSIERQMEIATRGWDAKVEKVKTDDAGEEGALQGVPEAVREPGRPGGEGGAAKHRAGLGRSGYGPRRTTPSTSGRRASRSAWARPASSPRVAIMASSGATFGASAIPGILGVMRTSAQLAQQCKALYDELETTIKQLNRNLAKVSATYKNASTAKLAAAEMSAMLIQKVLVVEMPSIKLCQDLLGRGRSKCDGVVVKSHDIAKKLEKALNGVDAIAKKSDGKSRKKLEDISTRISMLIVGIQEEVKRADKGKRDLEASEKIVKALVARQPAFLAYVDKAMIVIDLAAGATSWSDIAQNATGVVLDLAVDKVFEKI